MFYKYIVIMMILLSCLVGDQVPDVVASVNKGEISRYELADLLNARYDFFDKLSANEKEKQMEIIDSLQKSVVFAALEELITIELTKQKLQKLKIECTKDDYIKEAERSERPFFDLYLKWGLENPISFIESMGKIISKDKEFSLKYTATLKRMRLKFQLTKEDKKELIAIWNDVDNKEDLHNKARVYVFKKHSITMDNFKKRVKVNAYLRRYIEMKKDTSEIQKILDKDAFALSGGIVRMSHILILTVDPLSKKELNEANQKEAYQKILNIKSKINSDNKNFGEVAMVYSEDDTTKYRNGDLGFVPRWGVFAREIIERAYELEENQLSSPIKTTFGYHLILVTEKKTGNKLPIDEMKKKASERYISMKKEELLKLWYDSSKIERHLR